jgi:hypothetical protein
LLGQDFEALVAENDRLALSRFGNRRHDCQMISGVQRDRLGDHPHIAREVVEPGVHIVETLPHQSFDGWGGVQKMLEGGFHKHALADARSVGCDVKPTADALTKPNRHFATCRGFAFARRSNVPSIGLHILIGQLLHFPTIPKCPTIETAASRYD